MYIIANNYEPLSSFIENFTLFTHDVFFFSFLYSKLYYAVPDFISRSGHPIVNITSVSRTKIGGWFCRYVENFAAFSRCWNSTACRTGFHRHLQYSWRIVDVRVFQVPFFLYLIILYIFHEINYSHMIAIEL